MFAITFAGREQVTRPKVRSSLHYPKPVLCSIGIVFNRNKAQDTWQLPAVADSLIDTWNRDEVRAHRRHVDGIAEVLEGHVQRLEGQHHPLGAGSGSGDAGSGIAVDVWLTHHTRAAVGGRGRDGDSNLTHQDNLKKDAAQAVLFREVTSFSATDRKRIIIYFTLVVKVSHS